MITDPPTITKTWCASILDDTVLYLPVAHLVHKDTSLDSWLVQTIIIYVRHRFRFKLTKLCGYEANLLHVGKTKKTLSCVIWYRASSGDAKCIDVYTYTYIYIYYEYIIFLYILYYLQRISVGGKKRLLDRLFGPTVKMCVHSFFYFRCRYIRRYYT